MHKKAIYSNLIQKNIVDLLHMEFMALIWLMEHLEPMEHLELINLKNNHK